jgi:uncharacterized lipoprotein YddW (UPF0748 family)
MQLILRQSIPVGAALVMFVGGAGAEGAFEDFRAVWVSRFDYTPSSTSSINTVMSSAASMGITDVLFQVRGRADAFYNGSIYEPKATAAGSLDSLQVAIDAAHANGLKLHAWINTLPLWTAGSVPATNTNPPHPYYRVSNPTLQNPGFRLFDSSGNVEPSSGWSNYQGINPVLPDVHEHINNVVDDIATRYAVDGIHLDYIRHVAGNNWDRLPHDDLSHQMFFEATGLDGGNSLYTTQYRNFVMNRITDLVASIKDTVDAAEVATSREIALSAAVWRDPDIGKNSYLQDYRTWLQNDYLDIVMPMIYLSASNDNLFAPNLANTMSIQTNAKVAPGLGVYLHTTAGGGVDLTIEQLQRLYDAGTDGATFYHLPSFFGGDSLATQRRNAVIDWYADLEDPPVLEPTMLADFEVDEAPFGWTYNTSPVSQTFGLAASTTIDRVTSTAREGIGSQELNLVSDGSGPWQLRHNSGVGTAASPAANVPFAATGSVGFWLKTDSPGVQVQLALDDPGTADRSLLTDVVADGQWHLYEWDLDDADQWEGWVNGDGVITGATVTLDSIFFYGNASTLLYMDMVAHNPHGSLLDLLPSVPGDFDGNGLVEIADYTTWRNAFGEAVEPGAGSDGNGDGFVNAADYTVWRNIFTGQGSLSSLDASAVPEPMTLLQSLLVALAAFIFRSARHRTQ